MLVFGMLEARSAFVQEEGERKEFFLPACVRNSLISLESAPEMEAKGRKWKGVSGLGCARLKFDCARLGADGASWKDKDFDFPEAGGGPMDAVDDRRNPKVVLRPWLPHGNRAR
jgi:hypothetical protein